MHAICLTAAFLLGTNDKPATWVYVSVAGEQRIAVYSLDEKTARLTHVSDVKVDGSPGSLTTDPKQRFLYASLRSTKKLGAFAIDPATGGLKSLGTVDAAADPAYVATDKTGHYLLSAYYRAGKIAVHRLGDDGRIAAKVRWYDTAEKAHAILPDRSNGFLLVPHTGPNRIFQFRFDAATGQAAPNEPASIFTGANTGPRHLAFHPKLNVVYFDNEQGSSVTAFHFDPARGTLKPFQTLSTLPTDFKQRNSCADLEISPDGRTLYAANRGHDSIAMFAVDAKTGRLKSLGQAPTERTPRSFNVDPTGRFLIAAGQSSGKLAAYRIDRGTGKLKRFATYETGSRPWWVLAVRYK